MQFPPVPATRFAYVRSCSIAAIRYVSVVIKPIFFFFSRRARAAIFAIVVVFPTPVGPRTLMYFLLKEMPPNGKSPISLFKKLFHNCELFFMGKIFFLRFHPIGKFHHPMCNEIVPISPCFSRCVSNGFISSGKR